MLYPKNLTLFKLKKKDSESSLKFRKKNVSTDVLVKKTTTSDIQECKLSTAQLNIKVKYHF